MKIFTCKICGLSYRKNGKNPISSFCSIKCKALWQHKYNVGKNHPRWRRDYERLKICKLCGKEFTNINPTTFQNMKFCSKKCADVGGFRYRGKEHPNWRGRRSKILQLRGQKEYIKWSKSIMKRDNYTCNVCRKIGGNLNAHHLKSFSDFPELRYVLSNGVTLCRSCHTKVHRPTKGSKFKGTVENGVNSVKIRGLDNHGQYRAELCNYKEGVEVSPEIMDINTLTDSQLCKI